MERRFLSFRTHQNRPENAKSDVKNRKMEGRRRSRSRAAGVGPKRQMTFFLRTFFTLTAAFFPPFSSSALIRCPQA